MYHELKEFFRAGGWTIAKFATNSKDVLQHIPVEERIGTLTLDFDKEEFGETRALGLLWKTDGDELSCKL